MSDRVTCHLRVMGRITHARLADLFEFMKDQDLHDEYDFDNLNCPECVFHACRGGLSTDAGLDLAALANEFDVVAVWFVFSHDEGNAFAQFWLPHGDCLEYPIRENFRELLVPLRLTDNQLEKARLFQELLGKGLVIVPEGQKRAPAISPLTSIVHGQPLAFWLETAAALWEQVVDPTYVLEYVKEATSQNCNCGMAQLREFVANLSIECDALYERVCEELDWDDSFYWEFVPRFMNWCVNWPEMELHPDYVERFVKAYQFDKTDLSRAAFQEPEGGGVP